MSVPYFAADPRNDGPPQLSAPGHIQTVAILARGSMRLIWLV